MRFMGWKRPQRARGGCVPESQQSITATSHDHGSIGSERRVSEEVRAPLVGLEELPRHAIPSPGCAIAADSEDLARLEAGREPRPRQPMAMRRIWWSPNSSCDRQAGRPATAGSGNVLRGAIESCPVP
jgi:hypothetical protein